MKPAKTFVQIICEIARAQGRPVHRVDFEPMGNKIVLTFVFKSDASGSEQGPPIDRAR